MVVIVPTLEGIAEKEKKKKTFVRFPMSDSAIQF